MPEFPEGGAPICEIAYNEVFREVMEYFNAIYALDEISQRAYTLTEEVLRLNAGHYTAWTYRRRCLDELALDLHAELDFLDSVAVEMQKSFQLWHHRRCVAQALSSPEREFAMLDTVLAADSKNYHAWSYRQWVVQHFKRYEGELEFTQKWLIKEPDNNSVWNHRYFILKEKGGLTEEGL